MEVNYIAVFMLNNIIWWWILSCFIMYTIIKQDMQWEEFYTKINGNLIMTGYPNEPNINPFNWMYILMWATSWWCLFWFILSLIILSLL